jgi:hypothetical protein
LGERARIGGLRWADGAAPAEVIAGMRAALGADARLLVLDRPGGVWRGHGEVLDGDLADVPAGDGAFVFARAAGDTLLLQRDPVGPRAQGRLLTRGSVHPGRSRAPLQ